MDLKELGLEEIEGLMELAKALAPVAEDIVKIAELYGHSIKKLADHVFDYQVNRKIRNVQMCEAAGFTREEAILLSIDCDVAERQFVKGMKK